MTNIVLEGEFVIVDPQALENSLITVFKPTVDTVTNAKQLINQDVKIDIKDLTGDWTNSKIVRISQVHYKEHEGQILILRVLTQKHSGLTISR